MIRRLIWAVMRWPLAFALLLLLRVVLPRLLPDNRP